jgi:hypothetical protein
MLKPAVMTLASLFLYSSQPMAAMQCAPGLTHVSVNGNVTTLNVSATRQAGQICMTMIRTSNGSEAFNDCGALVGNVVSADLESGSSSLTHTAVFDLRDMLVTRNDHAQITGVLNVDETGAPCAFNVVESISEIEKAAGIFRGGQININAIGTISFCPGQNLNTFTLQGEACVRR